MMSDAEILRLCAIERIKIIGCISAATNRRICVGLLAFADLVLPGNPHEANMTRSASLSTLPSTYDDFLYASVGEDQNGMLLTVLSVLARQNVDPWEEAADLSRLPEDTAMRKLTSMITALPGQSSTHADPTAVAGRLMALLPARVSSVGISDNAVLGQPAVNRSPAVARLLFIAIYIGLMFFGQWMAASIVGTAKVDVASTPSPRSTLAQTSPSPIGDNAHKNSNYN
jgi:hypothetical protein